MIDQFLSHIAKHQLLSPTDPVLLAVSGGVDSMVMLQLFSQTDWKVAVAHANFQLRGTDSSADEQLVRQTADTLGLPFFTKKFSPKAFAKTKGISLQMAARSQRYEWFEELCETHGFTQIATAHHLNDSFETLLMNLVRGTGIDGIAGIPVVHELTIRPMLFASREEILAFAKSNDVRWREDSSNLSDHYHRNLVRNQVMPLLRTMNPNLESTFVRTLERLTGGQYFAKEFINQFKQKAVVLTASGMTVDRHLVLQSAHPAVLMWEILKPLGFHYDQCADMVSTEQTGKIFIGETHTLAVDRDQFYVSHNYQPSCFQCEIASLDVPYTMNGITLSFSLEDGKSNIINKDPAYAALDFEKIKLPLLWRAHRPGDHFVPLGMKQRKKISDFLIDQKISVLAKRNVTVLESSGVIVWVTGMRIADPFKVTDQTKQVLIIKTND